MRRRDFVKTGALLAGANSLFRPQMWADVPDHLWEGYQFGSPQVANGLTRDHLHRPGPRLVHDLRTQPSRDHIRNFGAGLVGYTWEENGPALGVQCGRETLEQSVEKMASLPFVDVLYIRCDWRDVQTGPGKLTLSPVWDITLDTAKRHNLELDSASSSPARMFNPKSFRCRISYMTECPS